MMENCPGLIKMSLMIKKHLLAFIILCGASFSTFAVSLEEELELGAQEHRKILAQYGVYRDKELKT